MQLYFPHSRERFDVSKTMEEKNTNRIIAGPTPFSDLNLAKYFWEFEKETKVISVKHFAIYKEDDVGFVIEDLGSKHGTQVNGELVQDEGIVLNDGDLIKLAQNEHFQMEVMILGTVQDISKIGLYFSRGYKGFLVEGHRVTLTRTEFQLLNFLYKNAGKICTHDEIIDAVWEYTSQGNMHKYIGRVRQKLDKACQENVGEDYIQTVTGGYRLVKEARST